MALPSNLFTAAFREERLGIMFAILMASLVYLATLAIAAQSILATASNGWSRNVQEQLTIEVPFPAGENSSTQEERVKKIMDALNHIPKIRRIEALSELEVARLLKPWFNKKALLASLPLPTLIDIETEGVTLSTDALHKKLTPLVDDILVSSRAEGLSRMLRFVDSLRLLAGLMIALTTLTLVIAITLICRAATAVQRETIELLHFMGATDSDIVRQFVSHARRLAIPASLTGFAAAVITTIFLMYLVQSAWSQPAVFHANWLIPSLVMALIPTAAVLVAHVAARIAVLTFLQRMP